MLEAHEVIEEVLKGILRGWDHYLIDISGKYVCYSRCYGGGAFSGAIRYNLKDHFMILDAIGFSRLIRQPFDLSDPDSFDKMGGAILRIVDKMQTNRNSKWTKGSIKVRNRR